jgi:hypothetical protein
MKSFFVSVLTGLTLAGGALAVAIKLNQPETEKFTHYSLPDQIATLQQNWTADIRQTLSHLSFGSQILPVAWFLNLEHPEKPGKLSDPERLEELGFIPSLHATNNTYGLPVGFSLSERDHEPWFGLNCAACHTGRVSIGDQTLLIDGGAGLLDFGRFEQLLLAALQHTLDNPARFERFAQRLQLPPGPLRQAMQARADYFTKRLTINHTEVPYGYGRLDAFGIIFNTISAEALGLPQNRHSPDAPVSIPVLWDASHHDSVQWNGSAPNREPGPLGQNVPTALAVYGQIALSDKPYWGYHSSVEIKNLGLFQRHYYQLTSPLWPDHLLGKPDPEDVSRGKTLYTTECLACHAISNRFDSQRQFTSVLVPLESIGTDPAMASNFVDRRVNSGKLAGQKTLLFAGPVIGAQTQPVELVAHAAIGALLRHPLDSLTALYTEFAKNPATELDFTRKAYRARPLNGIWTSAPYLHNGSVPSVWDLLQPPAQRPVQFYVGSHQLDSDKLGFDAKPGPHRSLFDTRLAGNSNQGHLYGTQLPERDKRALIAYLKTL